MSFRIILRTSKFFLFITLLLLSCYCMAQNTVSGIIVSADTRQPVAGATVTVKNTEKKAITDNIGKFKIDANETDWLIITNIGYLDREVRANEAASITLQTDLKNLSEVVVTALGIKREEKSLGYAAQTVKENAVKDARTNNWVNSLSGKVAGLNIQGTGAGPIGSSRITLRGESSLNLDNNQALIIIDGVPVSSKITGTGFTSHLSADSPVDFGSDISDLNPDDIEKITVLKGPGATALYGSRAAGGAIIITTKSGQRKDKGIGVTYNTNVSIDQVNRWPDYQFEYGEGRTMSYYSYGDSPDGVNTSTGVAAGRAWGPKFYGQSYFQYDPSTPDNKAAARTPWVPDEDYISGFFRTGFTISNSVSIEGGSEKGSARLSFTHLKNEWILPNTGFQRINASLSVNQKISDRLKISGKVNYSNKKSDNLPAAGYNNQTIMYFLIIGTAPNIKPRMVQAILATGFRRCATKKSF